MSTLLATGALFSWVLVFLSKYVYVETNKSADWIHVALAGLGFFLIFLPEGDRSFKNKEIIAFVLVASLFIHVTSDVPSQAGTVAIIAAHTIAQLSHDFQESSRAAAGTAYAAALLAASIFVVYRNDRHFWEKKAASPGADRYAAGPGNAKEIKIDRQVQEF